MIFSIRSRALVALALVCVAGAVSAQPPPVVQQVLKDVWVATDSALFEATYAEAPTSELVEVPGDYTVGSARSLAFEPPQLGSGAVRDLIAVEGNLLRRFSRDGATAPLFDAGTGLSDLTLVNAVAVADDGTVLFSGFARRKRVCELWGAQSADSGGPAPRDGHAPVDGCRLCRHRGCRCGSASRRRWSVGRHRQSHHVLSQAC